MPIRIAALHYYPIKSCAGINAASVMLEDMGFAHDRRWMVVRAEDGRFVSQREFPKMACICPSISASGLSVSAHGMSDLKVDLTHDSGQNRRPATVWKHEGLASDEGDVAASWFSDILGFPCRLVKAGSSWTRLAGQEADGPAPARVGFADGYAVLLASESSLVDLNARLDAPVPMDRFRANVIIEGDDLTPWAEDGWTAVDLPNSGRVLRFAKPCARCSVITVDQSTGKWAGAEPLRTLAEFRRTEDNKVLFGSNLIYDSGHPPVKISVGDPVVPIQRK